MTVIDILVRIVWNIRFVFFCRSDVLTDNGKEKHPVLQDATRGIFIFLN